MRTGKSAQQSGAAGSLVRNDVREDTRRHGETFRRGIQETPECGLDFRIVGAPSFHKGVGAPEADMPVAGQVAQEVGFEARKLDGLGKPIEFVLAELVSTEGDVALDNGLKIGGPNDPVGRQFLLAKDVVPGKVFPEDVH